MKRILTALLTVTIVAGPLWAEGEAPGRPTKEDKCPVCGMFVAKYPDFVAQVAFKDGSKAWFDGAKDLFKYYWGLSKFNPAKVQGDVQAIYVTDYYDLKPVDGRSAYYVVGSDVYGPMGKELIPFEKEEAAREFLADHGGTSILRFKDITLNVLKPLD